MTTNNRTNTTVDSTLDDLVEEDARTFNHKMSAIVNEQNTITGNERAAAHRSHWYPKHYVASTAYTTPIDRRAYQAAHKIYALCLHPPQESLGTEPGTPSGRRIKLIDAIAREIAKVME